VNDYFGTLATVLDLLRQNASRGYKREHDRLLCSCAMIWCFYSTAFVSSEPRLR
jgi:hypothetical protein